MLEPLIEKDATGKESDEFKMETVKEFLKDPSSFKNKYSYPLRHYNQLILDFSTDKITTLLKKLYISPDGKTFTIIGGYTGQFAEALSQAGFKIIFTDPIEDYVNQFKNKGYESYCHSVEGLPAILFQRSHLFGTFECYMAFGKESLIYSTLRLLTAPYGLIFAQSKQTRSEMEKESEEKYNIKTSLSQMKNTFLPYAKHYGITRRYRDYKDLRFFHFYGDNSQRDQITKDCQVIKLLNDTSPNSKEDVNINTKMIEKLHNISDFKMNEIIDSINRINLVYYDHIGPTLKGIFPRNQFYINFKNYKNELLL